MLSSVRVHRGVPERAALVAIGLGCIGAGWMIADAIPRSGRGDAFLLVLWGAFVIIIGAVRTEIVRVDRHELVFFPSSKLRRAERFRRNSVDSIRIDGRLMSSATVLLVDGSSRLIPIGAVWPPSRMTNRLRDAGLVIDSDPSASEVDEVVDVAMQRDSRSM